MVGENIEINPQKFKKLIRGGDVFAEKEQGVKVGKKC